jgi:hypothetical protein
MSPRTYKIPVKKLKIPVVPSASTPNTGQKAIQRRRPGLVRLHRYGVEGGAGEGKVGVLGLFDCIVMASKGSR